MRLVFGVNAETTYAVVTVFLVGFVFGVSEHPKRSFDD